ncbi:MAG: hypothetical protein ACK578_01850, partial [Pirellula sp.]
MRRVKEAFTAGNAVRFPDSNYFSTLIAGVQEGAKVSGDEAVDAAWSDFHQRTANVPDASKASFGIIQSVADNPSSFQSKLLHNDLGARSIDRSPLDSSTTFGPVVPTTQLVMQQFNAPLLSGSQRTASLESASSFAMLPDNAIGWFCTADGLVIDSNGHPIVGGHAMLTAEGEDDESLVPEVTLPELEAWNHSGSISTYQPRTNTNGQTISTLGSFTSSTTSDSDLTIPGVHSVHTINRVWIDSQHWSVTESLIFAFNITVDVPLTEPDDDSSGSDGSSGDDTGGSSRDLSQTHNVETTNSVIATITRKGFVILVFHAERGITTPSAAGMKWSFNVNYSDAITIGIEAGGESTVTPKEPSEEPEGSGSNGGGFEGDGSEGDGSEGGGGREGDIPDDFTGESSFGISASVTVWARGSISLSATPEIVMIGTESLSAIDTSFTYEDTVRVGVDVLLGGNWQSSSDSGDLNTPTDATVIEPPEGTQEALEGATPPAASSPSLGSGPVTVPADGRMGGSSSTGDMRSPDIGTDIPFNQPVGHGHQYGSSGGFNANAGASSSSGLRFAGKMRNNSELQSLAGSLRDGLNNKYGDGDRDNEILVYSTGEKTESPGSISTWTGKIITGHGIKDDKLADVLGELDQTFQMNSEKELELNPSEEVEKVIGGGSDNGLDFEILNITTTSLNTSPTTATYTSATLVEASFQQGDSSGSLEVANDAVDSGELKAEWTGDAYNLQDIQSTLMSRKSPPEGATGHSIYVTRDHDIWSFARSEKGDTTTSVAGEGDASNSGT